MSNTTNLRRQLAYQVIQEVQKAVIGKEDRVRKVMMAILSGDTFCWRIFPVWAKQPWLWLFPKH